ncbi:uncharacterized protein [Oscarella lobularis]|uniref:uncharacterized protein isoform X2 n=1 Tax=Oscarella lobularis TaxID=121494 RepID=UPI00331381F7
MNSTENSTRNAECLRDVFHSEVSASTSDPTAAYRASEAPFATATASSYESSANVAHSSTNDFAERGGEEENGTSDILKSFLEEADSDGAIDSCLSSISFHGNGIQMPPKNVSDRGRVICATTTKREEGEYDVVEKAPQLRGQLAFSGSVAPAVLPEVDDLSVFTFGADHREEEKLLSLEKSSKGLLDDYIDGSQAEASGNQTASGPASSVLSPVQNVADMFNSITINQTSEAGHLSRETFGVRSPVLNSADVSSAEHTSEIQSGALPVVAPPPPPPPTPPPSASLFQHALGSQMDEESLRQLFIQRGLLVPSGDGQWVWRNPARHGALATRPRVPEDSPSSIMNTATSPTSISGRLSPISEVSGQDWEMASVLDRASAPSPSPPPELPELAHAVYRWCKKSGRGARAKLRVDFIPHQICEGHVEVTVEKNGHVALVVEQYAEMARRWSGGKKGRDSYDFNLALRKTFQRFGGQPTVEQINGNVGRKFIFSKMSTDLIYQELTALGKERGPLSGEATGGGGGQGRAALSAAAVAPPPVRWSHMGPIAGGGASSAEFFGGGAVSDGRWHSSSSLPSARRTCQAKRIASCKPSPSKKSRRN